MSRKIVPLFLLDERLDRVRARYETLTIEEWRAKISGWSPHIENIAHQALEYQPHSTRVRRAKEYLASPPLNVEGVTPRYVKIAIALRGAANAWVETQAVIYALSDDALHRLIRAFELNAEAC